MTSELKKAFDQLEKIDVPEFNRKLAEELPFDDTAADEQEHETMIKLATLENHMQGCEDFRPSEVTEVIRCCVQLLNRVSTTGDFQEFTEDFGELKPEVVGQVILKTLPYGPLLDNGGRWPASQKAFWITVGEELGPDWIENFRSVGAFLKRVEGF